MSRLTTHDLDDIKARNPLADIAGGYVKLRRMGKRLVGPCPVCGGRATSQRFEILEDGDSWVCAVCPDGGDVIHLVMKVEGCDFKAAIERLGGQREIDAAASKKLYEAREKKRLEREKKSDDFREAERKRLWKAWQNAGEIHGTLAARYLEGRGLVLPAACPGLRFLAAAPYFHGEQLDDRGRKSPIVLHKGPAMLAAFIRPDGKFGGLHTTWLNVATSPDDVKPPGKVELHDPETGELLNSKKMRGSKAGAHIAIALTKDPKRLVVGEGIETVLAVWTSFHNAGRVLDDTAFWAAGDLGNMAGRSAKTVPHPTLKRPNGRAISVPNDQPDPDDPGLSIPDSVEELILLGDGDSEPVLTRFAMLRAARRYSRPGRTIRIAFAPAGRDFNDVLREDRF
ncbi:CHC2 zinc finger domain-containing protein [Bradyrhizobium sp. JYMT SZCCT0428]|uniref:DUF7146 domain-containing protein n=1 Tax=Bradyrhizobium sp. JYMT SZCCT0428 TaxID=2807673 RepID=UPI001BA8D7C4|nr:CHC2 zinc finger domain-containing protein [Bradyrhizobium sp. JYMT SZCCT0428]MBR1150107.1 DNA primase [Bradyrhizobium sp. JYMT SZCCT0428]